MSFSRDFRIRYAECDGYGHVNNTVYVRYLHETVLAGLPEAGPADGWRSRSLHIEYLRPALYGETIRVEGQVLGLAGSDLWLGFDLRLAATGEPVAAARLRTSRQDPETGEERPLPAALGQAPEARGLAPMPGSEPFPPAPPPPPGVYSMRRRVRWQDLSGARRVEDATYLDYVEDCGFGVVEAFGWPAARMLAEGFAILLRWHKVEFLAPARLGDELEVTTWASAVKRAMATRHFMLRRIADAALLARVHTLGVWVDLASGRPMRIPPGFLDDFGPNLVP